MTGSSGNGTQTTAAGRRRRDAAEPRGFLALAWAAEAVERLWGAFWPAAAVVGLFLALALVGGLGALGGWVHAGLLAAFAAGLAAALWRAARRLSLPDVDGARRRLERDSELAHRPLSGLLDRQAAGTLDRESRVLWRLHKARLRAAAKGLRVRFPAAPAAADPLALRGLVALLLAVAVVGAGGDWADRLGRAFSPQIAGAAAAPPPALDLFITPPDYTGAPPIYLQSQVPVRADEPTAGNGAAAGRAAGIPETLVVPVGSTLAGRVTGGTGAPVLRLGELSEPFEPIAGASYELETTISRGTRLAVEQDGEVLGAWPMTVRPDRPPSAAFAEDPSETDRWVLRLAYEVADDYGVAELTAMVRLRDRPLGAMDQEPIRLELSLPGRAPAEAEGTGFFDLTAHTWAGLPVRIQLTAEDAAGQTGVSEALSFVLPEREFSHPIAQALIDQRRTLIREPDYALEVAESLETLSLRPDRYRDDLAVFLALRTAARRLRLADEGAVLAHVDAIQRLLWDTALRIEDGELSLAARDLREAQQALMDALEGDASDEEIRRLMEQLREAMDRYLAAMQQQLLDQLARGAEIPQLPFDPDATVLDRDMLADMLDRMQSLAETGARDAARQMLSELQRMTEGLQSGAMGPPPDAMNQAMDLMEDLQALIDAQQALLDQTFREAQEGRQPGQQGQQEGQQGEGRPGLQGQSGGPSGSETQRALRRGLGEIMRDAGEMLGSIPQNLGRGERAMNRAEGALERGNPGAAVPSQTEALEALRQGLQDMADQIMQQMAERYGPGMGLMPMPNGAGRDPLGRPLGRQGFSTDDVEIPSEADTGRARRILDELRRRLNQRDRPNDERDYFERLLRQF